MEHEVYVPFPVGTVRQALTEPERVARCVPGVQLDADAAPQIPEGRLRLRVGSSTITYRGTLTVADRADAEGGSADGAAPVTFEAHGTEARGEGSVALTLTVRLAPASEPGPGTTLTCTGTLRSGGRLADADSRSTENAGRRLLDRFAANLASDLETRPAEAADDDDSPTAPGPSGPAAAAAAGVFDAEVPPPSLDPHSDADDVPDAAAAASGAAAGDVEDAGGTAHADGADDNYPDDPADPDDLAAPAEAAHARRTMIGRSAEEVDHAPPRGRYAPVPAPEANGASATLRWAAPAAAVVLASAVVVGRVLRRRR
ncbi:carbon monoxide dehydrogenase subunit G [Streptomyces sp. NPDC093589]|uniref:carbon monoxide dehydrogenase subunit G n=1 Tax=Streptomyces sp. NPDC093589 TaxID=3366043 RepID=UPI00381C476C